ncbi:hypothetical protein MMC13_007361 [Lambiella insularis]|nr:hypothetical protein [Lambiella insularis]
MALLDSPDVLHSPTSLQHVPFSSSGHSINTLPRQRRTTTPSRQTPQPRSPHQRAATDLVQSRPVADFRQRNDLKMSTSSSTEQLPSLTSDSSHRPSSRDTRFSGQSQWREDRPDGLARSFLTKSSRLLMRRKGGKLGLSSVRTLEWLEDTEDVTTKHVQELSKRRKSKHSRTESVGYEYMLKHSISDPYNFQHLTHTGAHQAKALRNASETDLVTEFSAIRASQAPRPELKGIKADQLDTRKRFMWIDSPSTASASPSMPSLSPTRSRDQWSERTRPTVRHTKSIDGFTRVASRSFSSPMPPLTPPPRGSSKMATTAAPSLPSALQESPTAPTFDAKPRSRSSSVYSDPQSPPREIVAMGNNDYHVDPATIAQAVTTPDDTAFTLGSYDEGSPSNGLADVPEEDESNPRAGYMVTDSRPPTSNSIRHTKSFPSVEFSPRKSRHHLPRTQSDTQMCAHSGWDVASDPTVPLPNEEVEDIPVRPRLSRRFSSGTKGLDASWEDDIDFCYEHAAEADSMFDWDKVSRNEVKESSKSREDTCDRSFDFGHLADLPFTSPTETMLDKKSHHTQSERPLSDATAPSTPLRSLTSAFETHSSPSVVSSATSMPGVATPGEQALLSHDVTVPWTSSGSILFPLSPSLLIPSEYSSRMTHEERFHQRLTNGETSKFQDSASNNGFDMPGQGDYSARSSTFPASNWNSQNSSFTDGPVSTDSLHLHDGSVASLPDLVYSKRAPFAAESLADHIASLNIADNPAKLGAIVDATRQEFIRKATSAESIDEEEPPIILPVVYPRQNISSDSLTQSPDIAEPKRLGAFFSTRTRSSSVATTLSGKSKSSRASYSLFPTVAAH